MKRARLQSSRLARLVTLSLCLASLLSSFAIVPLQTTSGKNAKSYLPFQGQSDGNGNGNVRRVTPIPPQPGAPPILNLPNIEDVRHAIHRRSHAPAAIPSLRRKQRNINPYPVSELRTRAATSLLLARSCPSGRGTLPERLSLPSANNSLSDSEPGLFASAPAPTDPLNLGMARIDPRNRTGTGGEDLLSDNVNWNLPLVGLPGRGLDLDLSLSYNSLVWTRAGGYVSFDPGNDAISPGLRLGIPTVEGPYWNDQANTYFYMFITPSGGRVELRNSGGNIYEIERLCTPSVDR